MESISLKARRNCAFEFENYEFSALSTVAERFYEDPLQTVPDLETLEMKAATGAAFTEQEVPDEALYLQMHSEATPVRMDTLYAKPHKITPMALKFDNDVSVSKPICPRQNTTIKPAKRKKSNRRSYLSSDLPAEIRNQRRTVANARERARVGRMSNGYDALLKSLPKYLTASKMRKVDILNSAVCHIQNLMRLLADYRYDLNEEEHSRMFSNPGFADSKDQNVINQFAQNSIQLDYYSDIQNLSIQNCSFIES